MPTELMTRLSELESAPTMDGMAWADLGRRAMGAPAAEVEAVRAALVARLEGIEGAARARLELGEALGHLGDPRLCGPGDAAYWVDVTLDDGATLQVGRFHVTNAEMRQFVASGAYADEAHWSDGGLLWRDEATDWATLASPAEAAPFTVPNQPVVGASWWEAEAYAKAHGARLLSLAEHRGLVRGTEKRPYPWGSPFREGYAHTREEALGRPAAVGLYRMDRTPEGLFDLAGNVATWLGDEVGAQRIIHPGSWARPSMASWAKALDMVDAGTRSADLGFRLVRER